LAVTNGKRRLIERERKRVKRAGTTRRNAIERSFEISAAMTLRGQRKRVTRRRKTVKETLGEGKAPRN